MSLNLQYFASYPTDADAAAKRLCEATGGPSAPDVICVQEGLCGVDVLDAAGFELCVCAGMFGLAQSVQDMVYHDEVALKACPEANRSKLLCNQIYRRRSSAWQLDTSGCEQISSDLQLAGGGGRAQGPLALRTMVWAKFRCADNGQSPAAFVMNTHITGGRFEDQYFVQQLAQERCRQIERCQDFFMHRPNPEDGDVGILVGDMNATTEYRAGGAMSSYFKFGIAGSPGVGMDSSSAQLKSADELEDLFKNYMTSPFKAFARMGWHLAYGPELGITSGFGHLIDHMATSKPLVVERAEIVYLTNQKVGGLPPDTDLPITDHNAVKTVFLV